MRVIGVIPARYASSRLPGKPLKMIGDTSLVMRVFHRASQAGSLSAVYVATDDERIARHVDDSGGKVIMTSPSHESGTERCHEALQKAEGEFDYVMNIQGDEPFIDPLQIDLLAGLCDGATEIATLYKKITDPRDLMDEGIPKVAMGEKGMALYFSRAAIPHLRSFPKEEWLRHSDYFKHIGIYAYRKDVLATIAALPPSVTERMESLEQLRWLAHGYSIRAEETDKEGISVDTEEDLKRAIQFLKESGQG